MDAKITRKRLNDRLAYDWIKIVAVTILVTLLWSLLYSLTGVKLKPGEQFTLLIAGDRYSREEGDRFCQNVGGSGRLSYGVQNVMYEFLDPTGDFDEMELVIKLTEAEFDLAVFTDQPSLDENGDYKIDDDGYLKISAFRSYTDRNAVMGLDDAIAAAKEFLAPFFEEGYIGEGRRIKEEVVATYFRENKLDNRFRKESQILEGIEWEKARLIGYCEETLALEKLLAEHPEIFVSYRRYEQSYEVDMLAHKEQPGYVSSYTVGEEKRYGIDLSYFPNASKLVCGADGKTAKGCVLTLLNYYKRVGDLFFEGFAVINYFVETYGTFTE